MNQLTEEQIIQLAPDAPSLAAGKGLASAGKWMSYAYNDRVLWGEIKGSGAEPYRTQIDLISTAFKCNCPSRKFPCKHGLGLYLLFARSIDAFSKNYNEPAWVKEWMDKRAIKPAARPADQPHPDAETTAKQAKAKEKRQNKRLDEIAGGVAELDRWLKDLLRSGFLSFPEKSSQFWKKTAARMVDAKAPGLGNMVKEFQEINYVTGQSWQSEVLRQAARIYLLLEGARNIEKLPDAFQEDIKSLLGISRTQKELMEDDSAEKVKDVWLVMGRQREVTDDDLTIQRDWLYGTESKRMALILNFSYRNAPIQNLVVPGTATKAELVFYPSNWPMRAVIKMIGSQTGQFAEPAMHAHWDAAQEHYTQVLARFPWVETAPMFVRNLLPVPHPSGWYLQDTEGYGMPVHPSVDPQKVYQLLALSGGNATALAFVRQKDTIFPLGVWLEGRYRLL